MYLAIPKGTTSKIAHIFIESSASPGNGLTGLTFATASLTAKFIRPGDSADTTITLVTQTLGTWASGGFREVDSTAMPGTYEIGIPDACLANAAAANIVTIVFQGAANMFPCTVQYELTATSNQNSTTGGMSALPSAAAGASGGLIRNGTNAGTVTLASLVLTTNFAIGTNFSVGGNMSVAGSTTYTGAVLLSSTLGITGAVTLSSTLGISGLATLNSLTISGATTLTGAVSTGGNLTIGGTFGMVGMSITGDFQSQNFFISGQLTTGAVQFDSLEIAAAVIFDGTITATDAGNNITGVHADIVTDGISTTSMATDSLSAASVSAAAVTKIQSGLSTLTAAGVRTAVGLANPNLDTQLAAIQADTDNIQTRIPAALISGRIDATVGAMQANTLTASALATDAVNEITAATDVVLSGSHGAGLWTKSSSSGSGAFIVTVTVIDDFAAIVPGANVRLTQGINEYVAQATALGVASFSLDAATYTRSITKSGYTFTPDSITVSASANFGAVMTRIVFPGPPIDPSLCTVFGYLNNVRTGLPANYVELSATLSPDVPSYAGGILIGNQRSAASNQAGFVSLDVIKNSEITPAGSQWVLRCSPAGISSPQTLTTDTFDLSTVITS